MICSEHSKLERFALGEMSDEEFARIEAHVSNCRRCARRLAVIDGDDPLSREVKELFRSREALRPLLARMPEIDRTVSSTCFPTPSPST